MKLLIVLTLFLVFVACSPKDRLIFIVPSESGSEPEPAPMPLVGKKSAMPKVIHDEVKINKISVFSISITEGGSYSLDTI